MWKSIWTLLRGEYGGRILGISFSFFCGFIYLIAGFWDMLIFAFIVYLGYYVGRSVDQRQWPFDLKPFMNWLTERWKGFK